MRTKLIITAIAAAGLFGGVASAQSTGGAGVTASGKKGSIAAGGTHGKMKHQRMERRDERRDRRAQPAPTGNSSSTYGSGTVYTDRNTATGGVTAGGTATGTDLQRSTTTVDGYASTTRDGSNAEVYGDSTATSMPRPAPRPR